MAHKSLPLLIGIVSVLFVSVLLVGSVVVFALVRKRVTASHRKKASVKIKPKRPTLKLTIPQMKSDGLSHVQYPPIMRPIPPKFIIPNISPMNLPLTPSTPDTPGFLPSPFSGISPFDLQIANNLKAKDATGLDRGKSIRKRDDRPSSLWRKAVRTGVTNSIIQGAEKRSHSLSSQAAVKFCLKFEEESRELFLKIIDFEDLPLQKTTGRSFPYIKVFLYPGNHTTKKGLFDVHILHFPNETTCYFCGYTLEEFNECSLKLIILDYDKFSRADFSAEVYSLIRDLDKNGLIISRPLEVKDTLCCKHLGSLLLSLCYHPVSSEVSVVIMKASGLPSEDKDEKYITQDFFVKITLFKGGLIADKRRTKVAKRTSSPVFNEKLVFPVDEYGLCDVCMVFDIMVYVSRRKHIQIGSVAIGNNVPVRSVRPHELQHFNEMLNHPRKQTAEWHAIVDDR